MSEWRVQYEKARRLETEVPLHPEPSLSEDAMQLLDPESSYEGLSPKMSYNSQYSADSIIRRVEEEIAAARKAAEVAKSNLMTTSSEEKGFDEQEIQGVLDVSYSEDEKKIGEEGEPGHIPKVTSSLDQNYMNALDLIDEEFETDPSAGPSFDEGMRVASEDPVELVLEESSSTECGPLPASRSESPPPQPSVDSPEPSPVVTTDESSSPEPVRTIESESPRHVIPATETEPTPQARGSSRPAFFPDTASNNSSRSTTPRATPDVSSSGSPSKQQSMPSTPSSTYMTPKETDESMTPPPMSTTPEPRGNRPTQRSESRARAIVRNRREMRRRANEEAAATADASQSPAKSPRRVSPGKARKNAIPEIPPGQHNGRIRFRDPFPVLKPPASPRGARAIILDNTVGDPSQPIRWMKPKPDLKQLIVAAMGSSLQRRSNACGALKVITKSKVNQMKLVRTDSFLTALIFAASQDIPARRHRDLALDARTRAVACIRAVCEPKENRAHVLLHPGLIECMLKVIQEDTGEARVLACGAMALLAKSPNCREEMVEAESFVDVMAKVTAGAVHFPVGRSGANLGQGEMATVHEQDEEASTIGSMGSGGFTEEEDSDHHDDDSDDDDDDAHDETDEEGDHSDASSRSSDDSETSYESEEEPDTEPVESIRQKNQVLNNQFIERGRFNACAVLLHLSKHCSISMELCSNTTLMDSMIAVAKEKHATLSSKSLEILVNLSRFPTNNAIMTPYHGLVDVLVESTSAESAETRICAMRCFQNMSADPSSKLLLATDVVLSLLTACAMRKDPDEKSTAISALYNITTEPGAVVAITNTKNVVATLVHLAHSRESSEDDRSMACEALATISLWLQTLAGTGKVPLDSSNLPLPSQKSSGWERWE